MRPSDARRLYATRRWRRLRREILARDNWRCRRCGGYAAVGGPPEVHHVVRAEADPARFFDPANLETRCRACHLGEHAPPDTLDRRGWRRLAARVHASG